MFHMTSKICKKTPVTKSYLKANNRFTFIIKRTPSQMCNTFKNKLCRATNNKGKHLSSIYGRAFYENGQWSFGHQLFPQICSS